MAGRRLPFDSMERIERESLQRAQKQLNAVKRKVARAQEKQKAVERELSLLEEQRYEAQKNVDAAQFWISKRTDNGWNQKLK